MLVLNIVMPNVVLYFSNVPLFIHTLILIFYAFNLYICFLLAVVSFWPSRHTDVFAQSQQVVDELGSNICFHENVRATTGLGRGILRCRKVIS